MHVRTNIFAGEMPASSSPTADEVLNTAKNLFETANTVVANSLVDPNALKLFMNYLPAANQ